MHCQMRPTSFAVNRSTIMHTSSGQPAKDGVAFGLGWTRSDSGQPHRDVCTNTMAKIAPLLPDVIPEVVDASNSDTEEFKQLPLLLNTQA